jgi:multiple antibiotic resistance protein
MSATALVALATFFATVGPLDVALLFAALTDKNSAKERHAMALKSSLIGAAILLFFALAGEALLRILGITLPAFQTAGGILLLLIAIDMVFARRTGGTSTTAEENAEAEAKHDLSVFPLATPLIAGPGAIGAAILLVANTKGEASRIAIVVGALLAILFLTYVLMLIAAQVQRRIGVTGSHVIARVAGILLAALAVQFVFDGIKASGLIAPA